jgi:peptide/nickel transport system substrate-binding protein
MVLDGGGWLFAPTYLPTGEEIFLGGAGSNPGSYNDPTANRLISHSLTSSALGYLFDYENYLAKQLPVIWQPTPVEGLFEVSKDLEGVALNSFGSITPEYWHWKTPASQRP